MSIVLVNKNGKLLAKLEQKVSSKNNRNNGGKPDTRIQLSINIPSKGIHKQTSYVSDDEPSRKRNGKYREYDKKTYVKISYHIFKYIESNFLLY